jgi:hypothetical protein
VGDSSYWQRLMHAAAGVAQPVADCAPGTEFVFCDEYARLSPCAFTSDELGVPLDSVTTLDELPLRYRQARARACPAACHDCPSTQVFGKFAADVDLPFRALRAVPEWVSA